MNDEKDLIQQLLTQQKKYESDLSQLKERQEASEKVYLDTLQSTLNNQKMLELKIGKTSQKINVSFVLAVLIALLGTVALIINLFFGCECIPTVVSIILICLSAAGIFSSLFLFLYEKR